MKMWVVRNFFLTSLLYIFQQTLMRGTWGFGVLMFFSCGDAVNRISICGVGVISNPSVCDVCVFHAAVFGEMKLLRCYCSFLFGLSQT